MLSLKEMQQEFANDILNLSVDNKRYQSNGHFKVNELMQIYHNNHFFTLIDALKASYACILRLVGEDFFKFIALEYIQSHPLNTGYLKPYGSVFYQFIKKHKLCQNMPYLSDVALLEYYYECCYHKENVSFKDTLVDIENEIHQVYLLKSHYPILSIWQLNEDSPKVDLNSGGDYVLLYKKYDKVNVISLTSIQYQYLYEMKNNL